MRGDFGDEGGLVAIVAGLGGPELVGAVLSLTSSRQALDQARGH